jgi:RHS repeat-associated protein
LTDFVGAIVELYSFDAYGNAIGFDPSVALTEFLYSGEQFDSKIGQQYLRQRYYDPATGRFNRLDPFFGNLDDPQSLHKYLYTHADPVNGIDPSGNMSMAVSVGISIAIGAGIGAGVGGYFGGVKGALLGAFSGAAAGAIGVLSFSGALALCGYYGFSTLGTLFIAGAISGIASGATGGFIEGFGYSMLDGNDFYASFYQGIAHARTGAGIGGVIGGIFAPGIFVAKSGIQFVRSVQAARAILEAEQAAGRITAAEANALRANLGRFSTAEDVAEASNSMKLVLKQARKCFKYSFHA